MKRSTEIIVLLDANGDIVGKRYATDEEELKQLKASVFGFFKVGRATLTYEDGVDNAKN